MKSLRLLAFALLACACTASAALACDAHKSGKNKSTTTAVAAAATAKSLGQGKACAAKIAAAHAAHAGCTAEMAAACTPEMAAACMSNTAVASAMGCERDKGTTAAFASNGKSAKSAMGGDCCATKGAATKSAAVAAKSAAHDCPACADWTACEENVQSLGARAQVVALKNGAMIVYTVESPGDVKALQATVTKRHERMLSALSAGGSKKLCPDCKALRGAIASGKLHREVVNVERGCMTLLTSNDPSIITRIRNMTGQPVAMR